jgi:GrpB-like predicted nucleotidyltransferase (UPF0157 family)
MSFRGKRELLVQVAPRSSSARHGQRSVILDEFVAVTGYERKYAIRLLLGPIRPPAPIRRPRVAHYGVDVQQALGVVWSGTAAGGNVHDSYAWAQVDMYEQEKAAVLCANGPRLVAIEHVGSTAVPGLGAKPIVDVMAGLPSLADAAGCIAPLEALGYHFVAEAMRDLPDDRYFERWTEGYEQGIETAHLHLTEYGSAFWREHLLFRDRLRAQPQTAAAYEQLKRELAQRTPGTAYVYAKTSFVQSVLAQARD